MRTAVDECVTCNKTSVATKELQRSCRGLQRPAEAGRWQASRRGERGEAWMHPAPRIGPNAPQLSRNVWTYSSAEYVQRGRHLVKGIAGSCCSPQGANTALRTSVHGWARWARWAIGAPGLRIQSSSLTMPKVGCVDYWVLRATNYYVCATCVVCVVVCVCVRDIA